MKRITYLLLLSLLAIVLNSCKKLIEVGPPPTSLNTGNVYTTDATAAAVLTDIYTSISAQNQDLRDANINGLRLFASLSADELVLFDLNSTDLVQYYRNELNKNMKQNFWERLYKTVFACNNALQGLSASTTLTPAVKQQLLGEAHFMRAF